MKKAALFPVLVLYFLVSGFVDVYYYEYEPVFMDRTEMEKSIGSESPRPVTEPGKIYVKDQFVFIVEKGRGIHVIDNSDPEHPTNRAFIHIDGCIDLAIKDHVLYADNAADLVALSVNPSWSGITVTERFRNVFPEPLAPDGRDLSYEEKLARPENSVLVRWKRRNQ